MMGYYWDHLGGFGGFGMGLGMLFMLLFWALVIAGIVYLVRALGNGTRGADTGGNRALDILQERYARGEIGHEEYEQKKRDLLAT